jgi:hypothetical protein
MISWKVWGRVYICGRNVFIDASGALHPRRTAAPGRLRPSKTDEKYGFIDSTGSFKISAVFDMARPFRGGYDAVKVGEKWGFVDTSGKIIWGPVPRNGRNTTLILDGPKKKRKKAAKAFQKTSNRRSIVSQNPDPFS